MSGVRFLYYVYQYWVTRHPNPAYSHTNDISLYEACQDILLVLLKDNSELCGSSDKLLYRFFDMIHYSYLIMLVALFIELLSSFPKEFTQIVGLFIKSKHLFCKRVSAPFLLAFYNIKEEM